MLVTGCVGSGFAHVERDPVGGGESKARAQPDPTGERSEYLSKNPLVFDVCMFQNPPIWLQTGAAGQGGSGRGGAHTCAF